MAANLGPTNCEALSICYFCYTFSSILCPTAASGKFETGEPRTLDIIEMQAIDFSEEQALDLEAVSIVMQNPMPQNYRWTAPKQERNVTAPAPLIEVDVSLYL